jgi:hypothetical protein
VAASAAGIDAAQSLSQLRDGKVTAFEPRQLQLQARDGWLAGLGVLEVAGQPREPAAFEPILGELPEGRSCQVRVPVEMPTSHGDPPMMPKKVRISAQAERLRETHFQHRKILFGP